MLKRKLIRNLISVLTFILSPDIGLHKSQYELVLGREPVELGV